MKIVYLHQYFNTPNMSGGTRSYEVARRLVQKGHEVHMITSWRDETDAVDWFETDEAGIHVHWLPVRYSNHMSYSDRIGAFFRFALSATRKAALIQGDVVFATSTPLTIAIPGVLASRRLKVPMIFEVRDLWPELPIAMGALKNPVTRAIAKWLEKWAYRNSRTIIALSPGMRDGVAAIGFPKDRIAVIPNSSDNGFFTPDDSARERFRRQREWLGNRPLLVYAGTFGLINGVGYLVELARHLRVLEPDARILLVGDGMERDKVERDARAAGVLGVNLFMESKIPKKQIPALLSAADMACSLFIDKPEMRANSANKFFDTLASGTPVLLNYGGWQMELVKSHGVGITTWNSDIEFAAKEVARALKDKNWLEDAGKAARNLAEQLFDRDKLVDELERVIIATVNGEPERASVISPGAYQAL